MTASGLKKKLKLTTVAVSKGKLGAEGDSFEVMINPAGFSRTLGICFSEDQAQGAIGSEQKFTRVSPDKLSFDIVLDGTGVVEVPEGGDGADDVKTQVKNLRTVVSRYEGSIHDVNVVKILWGTTLFYGRLDTLELEYTLFKPDGDPLRAKVKMSFTEFLSKEEEVKKKANESPDMTHLIEVMAFDTLPALCRKIYGDDAYYPDVARINNLVNFRRIEPGTRLRFPPLR